MVDHNSDHRPNPSEQAHPLSKIVSLPANLIDLEHENIGKNSSMAKTSMTTATLRKQIQFNLEEKKKPETADSMPKVQKNASSLHEILKQLKIDEMKKRKSSGSGDVKKKKKTKSRFDLKEMRLKVDEIKKNMYHFLERPMGPFGFIYRMFTLAIILGSILIGAAATLKSFEKQSEHLMFYYEIFVTVYFSSEYALRVWSSGTCAKYKGILGRIRFIFTPLLVIEAVLIGVNIVHLSLFPDALSVMRFFQLIRFLYIDRQAQTWIILMKVIHQHRFELLSSFYIGIIILLFSSYFIMLVEKPFSDQNDDNHFHSYADAMYWSIITMTTIGYGDRSPRTFLGKIVSTSLCIAGVAFWTLPGGIIGSGFALKVEQKNRQKQFNRLVPAAVQLIQAWWRMKATIFISSSNVGCLVATVSTFDISKPIYSSSLRRLKRRLDSGSSSNYDELSTLFSGLDSPTVRDNNPGGHKRPGFGLGAEDEEEDGLRRGGGAPTPVVMRNQQQQPFIPRQNSFHPGGSSHSSNATTHDDSVLMQLSPEHLMLIRTVLLLKFFVARRKFKLAFKPYDFKDVIEKYTQGNMDMSMKMKELQKKFDHLLTAVNPHSNYNEGHGHHHRSRSPTSSIHSSNQDTIHGHIQTPRPSGQHLFGPMSSRLSGRGANRLSSPPPSVICEDVVLNENKTINRITKLENEINGLNSKMDQLIRLVSMNQTEPRSKENHES